MNLKTKNKVNSNIKSQPKKSMLEAKYSEDLYFKYGLEEFDLSYLVKNFARNVPTNSSAIKYKNQLIIVK